MVKKSDLLKEDNRSITTLVHIYEPQCFVLSAPFRQPANRSLPFTTPLVPPLPFSFSLLNLNYKIYNIYKEIERLRL